MKNACPRQCAREARTRPCHLLPAIIQKVPAVNRHEVRWIFLTTQLLRTMTLLNQHLVLTIRTLCSRNLIHQILVMASRPKNSKLTHRLLSVHILTHHPFTAAQFRKACITHLTQLLLPRVFTATIRHQASANHLPVLLQANTSTISTARLLTTLIQSSA